VLFLTTANSADTIPRPLLDRMEVIRIEGYHGRVEGTKSPRAPDSQAGEGKRLGSTAFRSTSSAVAQIISLYTREAACAAWSAKIARICRKTACKC
jgi:ATP-dependent Lon protease